MSSERSEGYSGSSNLSSQEDLKHGDIFSFGLVIGFMHTGEKPWNKWKTLSMDEPSLPENGKYDPYKENMPMQKLGGPLKDVYDVCRREKPEERPGAEKLMKDYFSSDKNPYQSEALKAEFFVCGFLKDTKIFVADSLVDETSEGYYHRRSERPQGYKMEFLQCKIILKPNKQPNCDLPPDWVEEQRETYKASYKKFKKQAKDKIIDDNTIIALKKLVTDRAGEEEDQKVEMEFAETTYVHHRAMREMWSALTEHQRSELVSCKGIVEPYYSTSFGLHVAVLTNEGPGKPQKFIFPQRSRRPGMASPGAFTCGAVESCSVKDYIDPHADPLYLSLISTAARGLEEELRVELRGGDLEAICLSTIYLKYDTHEWGICGFVDLTDERISEDHRLSYNQLKSRFTAGPKDKFEHETVHAVDFELEPMVDFVREHYQTFASSAKLVVVKVMQTFFGVHEVERAFQARDM
ncbi:uncharacterized protein LOC106170188 [Lingula anatina]|uniref:Uncharacterized protein LOC106170188 n=1 Tax=Lingula anatina TaxID=7574 RepID=A0A1S3J550_LINAN|nr:uncharacterized protein LOC106170188 [Lingula anatina]|eukprot:XP_013405413.1 uncharacterized protein LOC106170188 [Lingula anatina]